MALLFRVENAMLKKKELHANLICCQKCTAKQKGLKDRYRGLKIITISGDNNFTTTTKNFGIGDISSL